MSEHDVSPNSRACGPDDARPREQLLARARLVAASEAEVPAGLTPDQEAFLTAEVRRLRRERLLAFVARLVARSLHEEAAAATAPPQAGGSNDQRPPAATRRTT